MTHVTDGIDHILAEIRQLDSMQRQLLLEQLAVLMQQNTSSTDVSVLSLHGLGREIWEGMDGQAYVRRERASWHG